MLAEEPQIQQTHSQTHTDSVIYTHRHTYAKIKALAKELLRRGRVESGTAAVIVKKSQTI